MITLDRSVLSSMPLPVPDGNSDKNDRGQVLLIAGSQDVPGVAILCAEAALRAGAGKVQVAVPMGLTTAVGIALPETAVIGWDDSRADLPMDSPVRAAAKKADAILIGPGMMDVQRCCQLAEGILQDADKTFVLDAGALPKLRNARTAVQAKNGRAVLTPHAGEMAQLLGWDKNKVENDPVEAVQLAAETFQAVVALKGATTYIAHPKGILYRNDHGAVGLGTGGSGDVLAGLITALLGRGCSPLQATLWGVFVHAEAGFRLTKAVGTLGFLGREIPGQFPAILDELC